MRSDSRKTLQYILQELLFPHGFSRRRNSFLKHNCDNIIFVVPQKSAFWNQFYLNLRILFDSDNLDTREPGEFDIISRLEMLISENETEQLMSTLDFENCQSARDRFAYLEFLFAKYLHDFFDEYRSIDSVLSRFSDERIGLRKQNCFRGPRLRRFLGEP